MLKIFFNILLISYIVLITINNLSILKALFQTKTLQEDEIDVYFRRLFINGIGYLLGGYLFYFIG